MRSGALHTTHRSGAMSLAQRRYFPTCRCDPSPGVARFRTRRGLRFCPRAAVIGPVERPARADPGNLSIHIPGQQRRSHWGRDPKRTAAQLWGERRPSGAPRVELRGTANLPTSNAPGGDRLMTRAQHTEPSSRDRPVRGQRPLTERQLRVRPVALQDEIAAVGGAYQLTAGQIRRRLLLLQREVHVMLERWPDPDQPIAQNIWARRLARERSENARRECVLGR
jgi:hypothetical protein